MSTLVVDRGLGRSGGLGTLPLCAKRESGRTQRVHCIHGGTPCDRATPGVDPGPRRFLGGPGQYERIAANRQLNSRPL